MSSIFLPTYSVPLPADAEIYSKDSVTRARWIKDGKKYDGRLTKNRKSVLLESQTWYVRYYDQNGIEKKQKGYKDKKATEKLAQDIQTKIDRIRAGIYVTEEINSSSKSIGELIDLYVESLKQKDASDLHRKIVKMLLNRSRKENGWYSLSDIKIIDYKSWLHSLRAGTKTRKGIGPSTYNHYVRICKSFGNWLKRSKFCSSSPFEDLDQINDQTDVRIRRRSLSEKEFKKLIKVTMRSPRSGRHSREKLSGEQRALLYMMAACTGFRASELSSLTPESFDWESDPPIVTVEVKHSKNRKLLPVPISKRLMESCRQWIEGIQIGMPLFPGTWAKRRHAATMLRKDLEKAGIPFETSDGRYDFHALRVQFVTDLIRKGLSPAIVQRLARLSSVNLVMKHYTKLNLQELKDSIDS